MAFRGWEMNQVGPWISLKIRSRKEILNNTAISDYIWKRNKRNRKMTLRCCISFSDELYFESGNKNFPERGLEKWWICGSVCLLVLCWLFWGWFFFLFNVHMCVCLFWGGKWGQIPHLAERLQLLKDEGCSSFARENPESLRWKAGAAPQAGRKGGSWGVFQAYNKSYPSLFCS